MNDDADRELEARLHALVGGVHAPVVPAGDDVRRGRRRLFRVRVAMAGASAGALAVVLGVTGLATGDPTATEIPPAQQPASVLTTPSPSASSDDEPEAEPGRQESSADGGGSGAGRGSQPTSSSSSGEETSGQAGPGRSQQGDTGAASGRPSQSAPVVEPTQPPTETASEVPTEVPSSAAPSELPTPTATALPSTPPTTSPTSPTPTDPPTVDPTPPPADGIVRVHPTLSFYNDVLATHLDPTRTHLLAHDRLTGNKQTTWRDGVLFALGSRYAWVAEGRTETLQLQVASGWDQVGWACGDTGADWECHDGSLPGSEVAEHDGARQVAVEHEDGQVVVLTADDSFDGADEQELLEAAADERLTLPGAAPVAPPTLDADGFSMAGQALLVLGEEGESWLQTALDRGPSVTGDRYLAGVDRGALSWSAAPVYSGAAWTCLATYRSCADVEVGDDTVHVATFRTRAGTGWVVAHEGPSYVVSVTSEDRSLPRKRAYEFVTDEAWQPTR